MDNRQQELARLRQRLRQLEEMYASLRKTHRRIVYIVAIIAFLGGAAMGAVMTYNLIDPVTVISVGDKIHV